MALVDKVLKKIVNYSNLVMFSHLLFSLSFAITSMFLASRGVIYIDKFIYALIALVSARTGANSVNRVIDVKFDTLNSRTSDRHIPKGIVSIGEALYLSFICFIILIWASFKLSFICGILSPVALFFLVTYSYTKRFTFMCHYYLGFTTSIAPVGAYLAITGTFDSVIPFVLATANMFWVAGFDIIYGSQDVNFDNEQGLHSMSTKFGVKKALIISKISHIVTILSLFSLVFFTDLLGYIYILGVLLLSLLLLLEHKILKIKNVKKFNIAAYSFNKVFAVSFVVISLIDIYV